MTTRVCFQSRIRPELINEYTSEHAEVWPEVLAELTDAGRRNYSIFLSSDGLLIGYYETDDDEADRVRLSDSQVMSRWKQRMDRFFVQPDGQDHRASGTLVEVFNLDEQREESAQRRS